MTNPNCDVCCGRGKIRVSVYGSVSAFDVTKPHTIVEDTSREYPCPETAWRG